MDLVTSSLRTVYNPALIASYNITCNVTLLQTTIVSASMTESLEPVRTGLAETTSESETLNLTLDDFSWPIFYTIQVTHNSLNENSKISNEIQGTPLPCKTAHTKKCNFSTQINFVLAHHK